MKLNGVEVYRSEDGRYFTRRLIRNHYNYKSDNQEYIRRVYGHVKICEHCKKRFFTPNIKTKNCSDRCAKIGVKNPRWKGGRFMSGGYVVRNIEGTRIREHRYIMEQHFGRKLENHELVHHKNAIKTDNRLENLEVIMSYPKSGFHKGEMSCPQCQYKFFVK